MATNIRALPGAMSRAEVKPGQEHWTIEAGLPVRGDAFTDFGRKVMRVPNGDTALASLVRAHELAHAKFSPRFQSPAEMDELDRSTKGVPPRLLEAAEEVRINHLVRRAGYSIADLADGSEKNAGEQLGEMGTDEAWNEAVAFALATWTAETGGGKAHKQFVAGIRSKKPAWAKVLGEFAKAIKTQVKSTEVYAASLVQMDGATVGYHGFTVKLAKMASRLMSFTPSEEWLEGKTPASIRRSMAEGARRSASGKWADLVMSYPPLDVKVKALALRKVRTPGERGGAVRYPSRWVTDPRKRVFSTTRNASGGVVVIDQSGSMDMSAEDLEQMLDLAPNLTVIGYSHRPGDLTGQPNAWVMARNGRRVATPPEGNVGNGVDLPVLQFAQRLRHRTDPLIWICDGQTTDSNDHPYGMLEVARYIDRHHIHTVGTVREALEALRKGRAVVTKTKMAEGRVGDAWQRKGKR